LRSFLSLRFLQSVLALLGIALVVGIQIWLFERRENDHFAGPPAKGLTSGIWCSAGAVTQAGAAQVPTVSLPSCYGVQREPDTRFVEVVNAWIDFNRGIGAVREQMIAGLGLNGVTPEQVPAELSF
jgi:hypothetical protein